MSAPIVILTLAVADSIHILLSLRGLMREGLGKTEALVEAVRINFLPVSITSLTTIVYDPALPAAALSFLTASAQDDRNIVDRWSELAREHNLDLVVCVAAAQRRGIVDEGEAERNGKDATNIADGFRISGLGQLVEGAINSDHLVVFGD